MTAYISIMTLNNRTEMPEQKSVDPDQTAPQEQSDQSLHCLVFCHHSLDTLRDSESSLIKFLE